MDRGYVKLYRKKLDSDIWRYVNADRVFEFLMLSVTYRPHKYFVCGTCIDLQPGQFVSSDRVIAQRVYLTYQQTRTALYYLKSTQRITQEVTHHYSIYSIVNWDSYQKPSDDNNAVYGAPDNADLTQSQRRDNAEVTQKQEVKKSRRDQNPAAVAIYQFYAENIINDPSKRSDAIRNITKLLNSGHTKEDLAEAMEEYASKGPYEKPFHPNNFFGQKEYYKGFGKYAK